MKKSSVLIASLLIAFAIQVNSKSIIDFSSFDTHYYTPDDSSREVFAIVEEMPYFDGGSNAMNKYLVENLKYPEQALKDKIEGKVFVTFVVAYDGKIKDVKVLRGLTEEINNEAVRVVSNMPAWIPGKHRGKAVEVQYNLPIVFKL